MKRKKNEIRWYSGAIFSLTSKFAKSGSCLGGWGKSNEISNKHFLNIKSESELIAGSYSVLIRLISLISTFKSSEYFGLLFKTEERSAWLEFSATTYEFHQLYYTSK